MRYLSVCSGIEAATVAWREFGWTPLAFSEIDPFPRAVLRHHYPGVPLFGDFTAIRNNHLRRLCRDPAVDVLIGGTPCQSFSVAGLRKGLDDPRGNLTLEFIGLVRRTRPRWVAWENVPGVLSIDEGRAFASLLGGLTGWIVEPPKGGWQSAGIVPPADACSYGVAWRVLDAQYFGLAQRRKRVFVVAYPGDWRPPAAVLLEPGGLRGDPAPRRQAGEGVAQPVAAGSPGGSGYRLDADTAENLIPEVCGTVTPGAQFARPGNGSEVDCIITMATGQASAEITEDGSGPTLTCNHEAPIVALQFDTNQITHPANRSNPRPGDPCTTLSTFGEAPAVATHSMAPETSCGADLVAHEIDVSPALGVVRNERGALAVTAEPRYRVRRLTPRECERLQGFGDDYTLVPYRRGRPAADGPRYKALGNSMATHVVRWIGRRIALFEEVVS